MTAPTLLSLPPILAPLTQPFLSGHSHGILPSGLASHPSVETVFDKISEPLNQVALPLTHIGGVLSSFWGSLPRAGTAFLGDTGAICDTGMECLDTGLLSGDTGLTANPVSFAAAHPSIAEFANTLVTSSVGQALIQSGPQLGHSAILIAGAWLLRKGRSWASEKINKSTLTPDHKNSWRNRLIMAEGMLLTSGLLFGLRDWNVFDVFQFAQDHYLQLLYTGLIAGVVRYGTQWSSEYLKELESALRDELPLKETKWTKNIFNGIQGVLYAGGAYLILENWGIDVKSTILGAGIATLGIGMASREVLANVIDYWVSRLANYVFKKGDEVTLNAVHGTIEEQNYLFTIVKSVNASGIPKTHRIPNVFLMSQNISRVDMTDESQTLMAKLAVGHYVRQQDEEGEEYLGIVVSINAADKTFTIRLGEKPGEAKTRTFYQSEINPNAHANYGTEPKPLPHGLTRGRKISISSETGTITDYDMTTVTIAVETTPTTPAHETVIPRSLFDTAVYQIFKSDAESAEPPLPGEKSDGEKTAA